MRLVRQPNAGEGAARNRAIAEARGEYVALLDADDEWEPGFLEEIAALIGRYPGCGLYCTGFRIVSHDGIFPAEGPATRGVVGNFFRDSAHRYIAIPSACCIPRSVFDEVGGFPEGMKIAGDLYMWIKIGRRYRVCYSPEKLVRYSKVASNRSASSYTPERTAYSFEALYDPAAPVEEREFIARAAWARPSSSRPRGDTEAAARRALLRLYENLPPHAAQGASLEPPARPVARAAARPLQHPGVAPGPQGTVKHFNFQIMKPFFRMLLPTLLLLIPTIGCAQEDRTETLRSGGIDRTYHDPSPQGPAARSAPLVIVLHGYGGSADPAAFGMNPTADRHGFAVCYPQGERDGRGKSCWNVDIPFRPTCQSTTYSSSTS